jgi:hypothetical protein
MLQVFELSNPELAMSKPGKLAGLLNEEKGIEIDFAPESCALDAPVSSIPTALVGILVPLDQKMFWAWELPTT